jgi:predicted metal-dependent hydrolase
MFVNKIKQLVFSKEVDLPDREYEFKLVRSYRKSIALIIKDSILIIKCPVFITSSSINLILKRKKEWIKEKIKEQRRKKQIKEFNLKNNIYLFKGKTIKLKIFESHLKKILFQKRNVEVYGKDISLIKAQSILISWYQKQAKEYFTEKIKLISKEINIPYKKFTVKDYKSKWGLCFYSKAEISINWRLIMAPESVSRYVIIHELCHLVQPNHSKNFWKLVEDFFPDYKENKQWLKNRGFLLHF